MDASAGSSSPRRARAPRTGSGRSSTTSAGSTTRRVSTSSRSMRSSGRCARASATRRTQPAIEIARYRACGGKTLPRRLGRTAGDEGECAVCLPSRPLASCRPRAREKTPQTAGLAASELAATEYARRGLGASRRGRHRCRASAYPTLAGSPRGRSGVWRGRGSASHGTLVAVAERHGVQRPAPAPNRSGAVVSAGRTRRPPRLERDVPVLALRRGLALGQRRLERGDRAPGACAAAG